nr:glycosyltransferase [Rhizobium sullae]
MLDFADYVTPFTKGDSPDGIDAFGVWGITKATSHDICRRYAARYEKPLLTLEYGFVSSLDIALNGSIQHSLIVCPGPIYYDSTQVTAPEAMLNNSAFAISSEQRARARLCIDRLVETKVTKYNHAPIIDMNDRLGPRHKPRILLVDQRRGDKSVSMGLAGSTTFRRMFEHALEMEDHDIVVKLHPDAISGGMGSYLLPLIEEFGADRVTVIDYEVNPFSLFEAVDKVFVAVSQIGLEALFAGKDVYCFGVPFYAGWGLTNDIVAVPRRRLTRTLEEIFHVFYLYFSRYWVPGSNYHELENLIEHIVKNRFQTTAAVSAVVKPIASQPVALRILMIVPSGRMGASGRYMQNLGESLVSRGCQVLILAEGRVQPAENGVRWSTIDFEGFRLSPSLRARIAGFMPNVVYMNGVRTRAQRTALEVVALSGAALAIQSEDDDIDVYLHHNTDANVEHLISLDQPSISEAHLAKFLAENNWVHTARVLSDPQYDRWVEPVLRILTNRMAKLHTAIWHPFAERLAKEYGKPTLVVPPVARNSDFSRGNLSQEERASILTRYGIDPKRIVFFLGGSVYDYSNDFQIFLRSLNELSNRTDAPLALIVAGRSKLPLDRIVAETLGRHIQSLIVPGPPDSVFMELTKVADVCCSPGGESRFELYRLPSRLVKSMAMGKPIVVGKCGFGASLRHGENAAITEGLDPKSWAESMTILLKEHDRKRIGEQGRQFALANFAADTVALNLRNAFEEILTGDQEVGIGVFRERNKNDWADVPLEEDATTHIALRNLMNSGMQTVKRVLHIGSGRCRELNDYIRLGASDVLLIEPQADCSEFLDGLCDGAGRIKVSRSAVVLQPSQDAALRIISYSSDREDCGVFSSVLEPRTLFETYPALREIGKETILATQLANVFSEFSARDNVGSLLVVEVNGLEADLFERTDPSFLCDFEWVIVKATLHPLYASGPTASRVERILLEAGFSARVLLEPGNDGCVFVVASRLVN